MRHPLLGPLCILLLALLLAFTVMHGAHDQMHAGDGDLILCVGFLLTAIVVLLLPLLGSLPMDRRWSPRGPPAFTVFASEPFLTRQRHLDAPIPLRI